MDVGHSFSDLMRERTQLRLVDLTLPTQQNNLTIAFTLSFEYEAPETAMRVANEFLTLILNEDARTRVNRASETTKFLDQGGQKIAERGGCHRRPDSRNQGPTS